MSIEGEIRRKLEALLADRTFVEGAMVLGPSGDTSALAAMLRAIDDTMLPRKVVFAVGDAFVTLSVSGRRLRALVSASEGIGVDRAVLGAVLSSNSDTLIDQVGAALQTLASAQGQLTMKREPDAADSGSGDAGVSVAALSMAWSIDLDTKPPSDIERFCLTLGPSLRAMGIIKDGQMSACLGDAALGAELGRLWAGDVPEFDPSFASFEDKLSDFVMISFPGILPDADVLCFVKLRKNSILAAISGESLNAICDAWRRAVSA